MSTIKIGVACHKPSELPKNNLFLPIRVGAALASNDLGLQRDDEGDNISKKNPQYCELTAQYWLWKNAKADYYGLCHYRRFLCFTNPNSKRNLRDQIEANAIDEDTKQIFGLENEALMRKEIESNDLVIGELQKVSKLYTPHGNKNTAYGHWQAHDRALIMEKDLVEMLNILDEVSPEVGASAREYLAGTKFLGFNCFVAKKELFNELCEIEFEVLEKLEKKVDLSNYCTQLTRIYGFMGEIISSAYFYHLEKSGKYKVKHVPLVYFNYTDPIKDIEPEFAGQKNVIPVLFNIADNNPDKFGTIWQSFLDYINDDYKYDVILLSDSMPTVLTRIYTEMAEKHKNISFRIIDIDVYRTRYGEKYNLEDKRKTLDEDENNYFSILPFIPYIFKKYKKMLVVDENVIFCDSVSQLWEEHREDKTLISAPRNAYILSRVNDVYYETMEGYLRKYMKDPFAFFSINVFIWNFEKYREKIKEEVIPPHYLFPNTKGFLRNKEEILNILCEGDVSYMDMRWATWLESNDYLKYQLPYAPFNYYQELMNARKNPGAIVYIDNDPWAMEKTDLYYYFWSVARKTKLYSSYLNKSSKLSVIRAKQKKPINITQKLFPVGSTNRGRMTKLFPKGTKRYKVAKSVLNSFRIN
ncbi:DUF4422 domain-containing protein [Candidatus Saccharibacteria bacterium]|nr:DUF4422 domain-containing protein [Candidatus Saccharibacteria bacterium]